MGSRISTYSILFTGLLIFFLGVISNATAQNNFLNRLSININAGYNFGDRGSSGLPLLESNFNSTTAASPTFEGGLQYAISPTWTIETGYQYASIEGQSSDFETTVNSLVFKNIIHLKRILSFGSISEIVNPFLSGGLALDQYSYSSPSISVDRRSTSFTLGAGLAIKASRNIDLITHYEYKLANNNLDNLDRGFKADLLNSLSVGIRFNLGSTTSDPNPTWKPAPEDKLATDYERISAKLKEIDELNKKVSKLENQQKTDQITNNSKAINNLAQRLDEAEALLSKMENKIAKKPSEDSAKSINKNIPLGIYVQIFATHNLNTAENIREQTVTYLEDYLNNTEDQIFITKRGQFYQVLIGEFREPERALRIRQVMSNRYADAFTITFPRPLNLQDVYDNLERVR